MIWLSTNFQSDLLLRNSTRTTNVQWTHALIFWPSLSWHSQGHLPSLLQDVEVPTTGMEESWHIGCQFFRGCSTLGVLPWVGLEISQGTGRLGTHHTGEERAWLSECCTPWWKCTCGVSPSASMHPLSADRNISVVLRDCRRKDEKRLFCFSHGLSGQEIASVCP